MAAVPTVSAISGIQRHFRLDDKIKTYIFPNGKQFQISTHKPQIRKALDHMQIVARVPSQHKLCHQGLLQDQQESIQGLTTWNQEKCFIYKALSLCLKTSVANILNSHKVYSTLLKQIILQNMLLCYYVILYLIYSIKWASSQNAHPLQFLD